VKKRNKILAVAALIVAAAAAATWYFTSKRGVAPTAYPDEYRYKALDVLAVHLSLQEKPDARSVYMEDGSGRPYGRYFEHAGLNCASNAAEGRFGLVFAVGSGPHDWLRLRSRTLDNGAMAWFFDVRSLSAAKFRKMLKEFPCEQVHLWMPGENEWLLTGRLGRHVLKLDSMLDLFSPDGAVEDLAEAECTSFPELFASYVGTREDVMPAFQGDLDAVVRPEVFISKEIPSMDWIVKGGADEDIYTSVMQEIRSMQVVRRLIVQGNMLARDAEKFGEAIDKWSAAMLRNPHDTMLLDRLYRLAVNAHAFERVGNLKGAAKCYETMVSVRPKDSAAMMRYADCMRRLGQKEIADVAEKRARELMK
jgi:hypothetical protein